MITLGRLNIEDASELHRRLNRRWKNSSSHALACRRYRLMCRAFIAIARNEATPGAYNAR